MQIDLISFIVPDYDTAISFFVTALSFDLIKDSPSNSNTGQPKRWFIVRPPGGITGILLAKASGERQIGVVSEQFGGRVGLFLRVEDFEKQYERMKGHGVEFLEVPTDEKYGQVVVFKDVIGNKWDLLRSPKSL